MRWRAISSKRALAEWFLGIKNLETKTTLALYLDIKAGQEARWKIQLIFLLEISRRSYWTEISSLRTSTSQV